jgi:iron complex outermembrane receptor protein
MGPSRTLILINGKRKNMSSLYTNVSRTWRNRSDISAIPTDAIERVEIFVMVHLLNTDLMPLPV